MLFANSSGQKGNSHKNIVSDFNRISNKPFLMKLLKCNVNAWHDTIISFSPVAFIMGIYSSLFLLLLHSTQSCLMLLQLISDSPYRVIHESFIWKGHRIESAIAYLQGGKFIWNCSQISNNIVKINTFKRSKIFFEEISIFLSNLLRLTNHPIITEIFQFL